MTSLIPFNYDSKEFRTIVKDGELWFVAKDVCDILDLGNPSQALSRIEADEKNTIILNEGIGNPEKSIINESGLYSLILGSRKDEAKLFKRWITHDVIPSIRKTGAYNLKPATPLDALQQTVAVLTEQAERINKLESTQQAIKEAVISEPDNWREDINRKLNKIAKAVGDKFQEIRTESYKLLESRAGVNLERRLDNKKARMFKEGVSKSVIDKANKLDVIDEDKKLREIYGKIVSEYLIKYVA